MKKNYLLLSVLLLSIFLAPIFSSAQITVVPSQTAAVLATKLVGPGVIMLNPTLTCFAAAEGTFSGTSSLSFDSGIVLTNGSAANTSRPASFFSSVANGTAGDPQLTALAGQQTYDACVLQFDFRPAGDTIKFQYVFGSEEYTSYTCTMYNDVFGFFISGPGITGTPNIALVPGTAIPVCINSVNCGPTGAGTLATCRALGTGSPFCTYYVNNNASTTIVYDGTTTTLTAISAVTPCDTFHLKIGVADASDDIYDSGVFLKAGSLTSNSFNSNVLGINPADTAFGSQFCVRGCAPGMFIFHNTGSLADSIVIHYLIGGTAVNGVDYTSILDSATIHVNDSTDTVFIYGLIVPPTGPKTVELYIYAPYSCGAGPTIIDSVELTIQDSLLLHINTPDTTICIGQSVTINTSADSSYQYSWSPAGTLNSNTLLSPTATPSITTTYSINAVYPSSGCPPKTENMTITVVDPPTLNVGPPIQNTCVGVNYQIGVTVTPASGSYTYSWTPATYSNISSSTIANPIVTPAAPGNTEFVVSVGTAVFGCGATDSFLLHVLPDSFSLYNPDTGICSPSGTYQIRANGDSEFTYIWTPTVGVSNPNIIDPTITPPGSTITYVITASYPGCPDMSHSITYTIENPNVNILIGDTTFCIGTYITIPVAVTPADSPYTFTWSPTVALSDPTVLEPSFFTLTPGVYTYYLTIQSDLGCTSTDSVTFNPAPPIQLAITPGNTTIMYGSNIQLQAINLSPNPLYYYWTPNNGTLDNPNINDPVATPVDSTTYTVYGMNTWGCSDSASVTITVDHTNECIPNAFSPNGDGLNDVFRICNLRYEKLVDFSVFNRWGQLVYHNTNDPTKGWDGTFNGVSQDVGVYNYVIILARVDGTNKVYKGSVTLIR